jgi:hypothetical protein
MEPDRSERSYLTGLPQGLPSDKSRIEDAGIGKKKTGAPLPVCSLFRLYSRDS